MSTPPSEPRTSAGEADAAAGEKAKAPAWLRPSVDYGPIAVFFLVYLKWGLLPATAGLMAATALALGAAYLVEKRVAVMPLVTAVIVGVFGGLTLWLQDETFIKMKPTIVQVIFAVVLIGGLLLRKPLLKMVLGQALVLDEEGWRRLTVRWAGFFLAMAALNEIVWRTQSTDFWVTFKVFGILALTLVFAVAQAPLLMRHKVAEQEEKS